MLKNLWIIISKWSINYRNKLRKIRSRKSKNYKNRKIKNRKDKQIGKTNFKRKRILKRKRNKVV